MKPNTAQDLDRLLESFYVAAFELDWARFRPQVLELLCAATGAVAAAWSTRAASDLPGEYAQWPQQARIDPQALVAARREPGKRERQLLEMPAEFGAYEHGWLLHIAHRGAHLQSVLLLCLPPGTATDLEFLRRAAGHLAQAGTLALSQFVQRDEWLHALGRPSRGCAALIDAKGAVYVASRRFRELIDAHYEGGPDFAVLPFKLPADLIEADQAARIQEFRQRGLHFRLSREGQLFLLHARRPHPLDVLSPREQEIARALAQGKTFKSVARECEIAISTVANHASRIYKKLGIFRREDLVGLLRKAATGKKT